jgi:hypothetical protein
LFAHSPKIVTDGLVLALDAGNVKSYPGAGVFWYDKSGNNNNGTLTNGPTFNTGSLGSIVFDATDEWVNVSPNSTLNLSSQGTIGVWCYPNLLQQENYAGLIGMTIGGQYAQQSYYLHWRQADTIIQGGIGNNGNYNVASCPLPTSIAWYNFVFTWNGSNVVLYQNGVSVSSATQTVNAQSLSSDVKIGGRMFYPDAPGAGEFNGRISIAQIYNRGLTALEVQQNYNATKGRYGL